MNIRDIRIDAPNGALFARSWDPDDRIDDVPIVLLHDSLGCVELWRDFPERLAQHTLRSVIAYDRLGFGQSDPHPGTLSRDFIREEAHGGFAAVLAQLDIRRFVAFGHSVGGGMAVGCAAEFREECLALVSESAQAFVEDRTLQGVLDARRKFTQPEQVDRLRRYHGDKAPWVLSAWIDTWLAPEYAAWTLDAELTRVRCPTLAIHGELDEFGSVAHVERIAATIPGAARTLVLPECGHVPHREEPATVLKAVTEFLAAL